MFKKFALTGLALLVILVTVASPVAAKGNGWYLSKPTVDLSVNACEATTGNLLKTVRVDFIMPPVPNQVIFYVYVNGVLAYEEEVTKSGQFDAFISTTARTINVKFDLTYKGVVKTSEITFQNPCPDGVR